MCISVLLKVFELFFVEMVLDVWLFSSRRLLTFIWLNHRCLAKDVEVNSIQVYFTNQRCLASDNLRTHLSVRIAFLCNDSLWFKHMIHITVSHFKCMDTQMMRKGNKSDDESLASRLEYGSRKTLAAFRFLACINNNNSLQKSLARLFQDDRWLFSKILLKGANLPTLYCKWLLCTAPPGCPFRSSFLDSTQY